jgi:hypothetical protein
MTEYFFEKLQKGITCRKSVLRSKVTEGLAPSHESIHYGIRRKGRGQKKHLHKMIDRVIT